MSTNRRNLAKSMAVRVRLACGIARSLITAICTLGAVCTTSAAGPLPWSSGSTTFQLTPGAPPSGNPTPVAVGDLNGDGHADLVTLMVPRPQRYVVVRRMDAAGLPAAPQLFPEPVFSDYPLPGALTIADLDGDGHADLVSPLWYMPGNGDGTLGAAQFLPRYQDVHLDVPPAVADMDGDGKADLVMASTSGYFEVFRGLGGGILDSLNAYLSRTNVPGSVQHLAVADLNHDSHPDVITSGAAGGTNVFLSNGDGTFASAVSVNAANGSIGIADLNGDGHPDLVVGTAVALGDGAGHFSAGTPLPLPALVIGDFDGDGRTDVVLADSSSVLVMRGDGAGQFSSWKRLTTGPSPFEAHATDFNLDARLDLVVLNTCGAPAQVFMNGPVGFVVPPSYPVGRAPVALAKLDANGDGTPDLVVGSRGSRTISMLLGTGGGNFTAVASAEVAAGLVALRVADLFGDGRHEIVVACDTSNSVSVIPVTTAGGFGTRVDLPAGAGPVDLDVGDLDHDGRQEAVVLSADHTMTEISADGLGNLSSHAFAASPSPTHGVSGVALADWSGDGNLDAGVSELGGASATDNGQDEIFFGDGLGNLVSGFWTDGHTAALAFSDLDQDGHPDLVRVFAWDSSGVHFAACLANFEPRPSETWSSGTGYPDNASYASMIGTPSKLVVADVNRDGEPDALITDIEANALHVILNQGSSLAGIPISLGVGNGPTGLVVSDLDGDGVPDVAIVDSHGDDVMLLLSASAGVPTAVTASLATADVAGTTARLRWSVVGLGAVGIERAAQHGGWAQIARVVPDGTGFVSYADAGLSPGMSYGYRLRLGSGAASPVSSETWLSVPISASLALKGTLENPSHGVIHASISLPGSSPARLQLFDITGRLIESRDVGSLGAGNHVVVLNGGRAVQPGVYLVRLSAMGQSLSARLVAFQ